MEQDELFRRMAVALAIGLLIGLERGWHSRDETDHQRTAGLRTFALTGLLGGVCGVLSATSSPLVLAAGLVAYAGALVVFSHLEATHELNFSVTGVVAGILTFALGAYATLGNETVAVAAGVAVVILLALREPLHSLIRNITWTEIRSALMLLAMSFLLLPILPRRTIDPWQVVNPFEIWLLAILIAAVSFAGYIAVRALGERRGIVVAAVAGGLTSSTATTVSFARIARENGDLSRLLAAGVLISGLTMAGRVIVLAGVVNPAMLGPLVPPIIAAAAVVAVSAALLMWRAQATDTEATKLEIRSPFELGTVLWLAVLIAAIMLIAKLAAGHVGAVGLKMLAAVSGIADVDALTLSMARLAGAEITARTAAGAILVGAGVNTLVKAAMATSIGGARLGRPVAIASAAAIGAGAAVYILMG